jgi:hypothetical protein
LTDSSSAKGPVSSRLSCTVESKDIFVLRWSRFFDKSQRKLSFYFFMYSQRPFFFVQASKNFFDFRKQKKKKIEAFFFFELRSTCIRVILFFW